MDKPAGAWIVVMVVLIALAIGYFVRPIPAKAPTPAPAAGAGISLPPLQYVANTDEYDIIANYASSTPLLASVGIVADASAVSSMRDFAAATIAEFKTGVDPARKGSLKIMYLISSSKQTISYIFTTYQDTGGAHGNTFFRTFTYDTKTGAELSIADIFKSGTDYLNKLSSISRAKLPKIIGAGFDQSMMMNGTAPDTKNFQNFFVDNNNLDLLFAPYDVAPYSAGPQTLAIPLADLSDILKPEYK